MEALSPGGTEPASLGELLRETRVAQGISQEALARELRLPLHLLHSLETDDWENVPPGRERPLARQVAHRLGLELGPYRALWDRLPGAPPEDLLRASKGERSERITTGILAATTVLLLLWLLVPGQNLRRGTLKGEATSESHVRLNHAPAPATTPYPVLGEVLPEAPLTEAGILVNLRVMDTCEAHILGEGGLDLKRTLRVSEPWTLRVKGAFTLHLDNSGVATVEVAGNRIPHDQGVGEAWTGIFAADGTWTPPKPSFPPPSPAPESESESDPGPSAEEVPPTEHKP